MDAPVYNVPIPYAAPIHGGFGPGRMLKVQGTVHPTARCFAVNLQCGPSVNPRDDIALHLSPVFTAPPRVVRNSLQSQCWGPEESHGVYFPFAAGQSYEIMILAEADHFKLAINGQHFSEFHYRLPIQRVTYLAIDGETTVSMCQFTGTARAPSPTFGMPYGQPSYPPAALAGPGYAPPPTMAPYGQAPSLYPPGPTGPYGQPQSSPYGQAPGSPYGQAPGSPYGQAPGSPYMGANPGYPMQGYPHSPKSQHKGGLGGLGAALGGLPLAAGLGAAAGMLGGHHGHKKHHKTSKAIPIGLGVGGAALAGAALMGHNPLKPKKLKKLYKHKHFKHKHKHGFGFHGRSSSSSSD